MNKGQLFKKERIKNFVNINLGQSPSSESYCESENGVPFFQGVSEFGIKYPIPKKYTDSPKKMASNGSVLISVRAPVGNINIANEDCCIGRGLAALNCSNNSFLAYLLKYHKKDWEKIQKGAIFSAINKIDIEDFEVYYTNNEQEQNKIVSILDQQQELIDNYKNKLHIIETQESYYLDEILSGRLRIYLTKDSIDYVTQQGWFLNNHLLKGFEKDFDNWIKVDYIKKIQFHEEKSLCSFANGSFENIISKNYNLYRIGDFGIIKTGNTPAKDDKENYGKEFNWYTTPDFNNGFVNDSKLKLSLQGYRKSRVANINDILVTCIGELGKIALVEKEGGFNQQINSIKVNEDFYYYYIYLLLKNHKSYIQSFSKKNVVDMINKTDFSNITLYATPLVAEQISIVNFIKLFEIQKNDINKKINLEEQKFDFLMDCLISGKIRVN